MYVRVKKGQVLAQNFFWQNFPLENWWWERKILSEPPLENWWSAQKILAEPPLGKVSGQCRKFRQNLPWEIYVHKRKIWQNLPLKIDLWDQKFRQNLSLEPGSFREKGWNFKERLGWARSRSRDWGVSATSLAVTEQTRGAEGQNVVVEGNLAREVGKRGKGNWSLEEGAIYSWKLGGFREGKKWQNGQFWWRRKGEGKV